MEYEKQRLLNRLEKYVPRNYDSNTRLYQKYVLNATPLK